MKYLNKFYLDKEKDIQVNLFIDKKDEMTYIIETPNHHTGNLITNLARVCETKTIKDENDMKIIKGTIPAYVIGNSNRDIYILNLGGIEVAKIYEDGEVEQRVQIPAIIKTLMSQTKDYKLGIDKTLVSAYIQKKSKLRTDLHTHMNANLSPDCLIALGIKHQLRYPLYYIKKIGLKLTKAQEEKIQAQRKNVEKEYANSDLVGKYLIRKIDDNTFINFADLILNNIENAEENIAKIRTSLAILKDGQAVFTNLEKVYLYRYVFAKGTPSSEKIEIKEEKINQIPEPDICDMVKQMLKDLDKTSIYAHNTLKQDKLLWIAREYQRQGVEYVEITDTDLTKKDKGIDVLKEIHEIMPKIEEETGVTIRFLAGIRRIPLTIVRDQKTNSNYLRENLDIIKTLAKSPYIVGSDFIGEEINDISELQPVITELVQYAVCEDEGFTIRIHAGENDSLKNNVGKSIDCIVNSLKPGQKMPRFRIGHGLHSVDLHSKEGEELIEKMKQTGAIIEFQLTSNVRLNNLSKLDNHPIKTFMKNGVKCLQGTDGCGFYGIDTIDEQLALTNLVGLTNEEFEQMKQVEEEVISHSKKYFEKKNKEFNKFLAGRDMKDALMKLQQENLEKGNKSTVTLRLSDKLDAEEELASIIKPLPTDKFPIIVAGGSFNAQEITTSVDNEIAKKIEQLIDVVDEEKVYFVIGHKMEAYEKIVLDTIKKLNKNIEVYAFVPKMISKEEKETIINSTITGVRICIEATAFGIYKSFNYEIFERRESIVIALAGNSPVSNLVQEAKNGKGKAKIFVNEKSEILREKAKSLEGYVQTFNADENLADMVIKTHPELKK
jgi:adenosine deaminase